MRKVSVEVLEDAAHPEGGYAVLVLHGVSSLPDGVTFRLKPVEARGSADLATGEAWPRGEQRPRAVRQTASGMELLIGPDIVESPALLPGTLGVIELPGAGLRGEFLWPSIRPTARPRRRNLSVVKPSQSARVSAKPKAEPRTAAVSGAAEKVAGGDALAARVLREGSSGGIAGGTDLAARADVPVTALDHATPATASVAEAIGTNVVQLNVARDTSAASQVREGRGDEQDRTAPAGTPKPEIRPLHERNGRDLLGRHALAAALACAVVGGAGYLLLRDRPAGDIAAGRAVQEQAIASSRASRSQPTAQQASTEPRGETIPIEITTRAALSQPEPSEPSPQRIDAAPSQSESAAPVAPAAAPPPAEVTLRMRGGGFQIAGELKGFDGTKYIIETRSAGTLTMDASRFECVGDACARPAAAILPLSERPSPAKPDVFRIEGAAALAGEFVPQLIRDYAASIGANASELPREPGHAGSRFRIADSRGAELATIEVLTASSASALTSLERGAAAIALVDRPAVAEAETRPASPQRAPRPARPQQAAAQPAPLPSEIVLGLDGIAAVTAPQNPTASLSIDNLARVLAGQITDWFELGQAPGAIAVYLPPDGTGSLETFVRQVLRPRSLELSRTARRLPSESEAADAAARDPRGLALVSLAAQRGARAISLEQSCGLIVRPTTFAVKTGEYPLVRRLSLQLAPQLSQPSARGLVRIAQSGEVQNALGAARIVDASIASLPIEDQSERMAWAANAPASAFDPAELRQMLTDLDGATRLSTTFRFVAGTNDLDARSKREIQRLAATLREPELAGRRIILAGFTDAGGKFQANLSASQRRASQVRGALLGAAGPGLDQRLLMAKGYGPLAPVGCNGTPEGTRLNRRVEVWVAGGRDLRLPR